jgi:hypothetical protein
VGYITKAGKFAFVLPTLDSDRAGEFHEGLAPVDLNEGMCSATNRCEFKYINPRGKVVIQPSKGAFTSAGAFSEGVAPVATGGGDREADGFLPVTNWGFIDRRGKLVVPGLFEQAGSVSEGLASACLSGKCGYIRLTGNRRS